MLGSSGQLPTAPETIQPWNPVNPETTVASYASPPQSWAAVAAQAPPVTSSSTLASDKTRRTQSGSWKQNLHFLQGTAVATKPLQDILKSNDVNIVAYKVKKNVTETDMRKGLSIKNCKLMTTSNEAPFLSYKITIDSKDFDRATQDTSLWPLGVGVRLFVNFDKDTSNNQANANQRSRRAGYVKKVTPYRW